MVELRVLGDVGAWSRDQRIDVGHARQQCVLAVLALEANRLVTADQFLERVWPGEPPRRGRHVLYSYLSRLRLLLAPAGARIERRPSGYVLCMDPDDVDAHRFQRLITQARAADDDQALDLFNEADALWRGEPFAGLDTPWLATARTALEAARDAARLDHAEVALRRGRHGELLPALSTSAEQHPLNERVAALLMQALYQAGCQAAALTVYDRVRRRLVDELGLDPGPALQRVRQQILTGEPGLVIARDSRETSVPAPPLSSFLGRSSELAAVTRLLNERRLVTLVGPAGVGKTRLAVEHAAGRTAWLVRLADISQAKLIAQAVADAVGLAQVAGDPARTVVRALASRCGLLILDNCEHLADDTAALVVELLAGCPDLRILATSRRPLDVDGETTLRLEPLPTETAVELLLDRVGAVRPQWTPRSEDIASARQICEALDDLPLAVELAAGRARTLCLGEIAERLEDRFALLGPVPRGSLAHHATLSEAIAWSVELLSDDDRACWQRLWPFEGGFSLDAAGHVSGRGAVLEPVSSLVSRSMITADTTSSPTRYRMLETLRAYCRSADPEPVATLAAHATWMRELATWCAGELTGPRSGRAIRVLGREWPNLRAGIAHDLAHQPSSALRTAGLLDWFWIRSGHVSESRALIDEALRAAPLASTVDRVRALASAAGLAYYAGDLGQAVRLHDLSLATLGSPADDEQVVLHGKLHYYIAIAELVRCHLEVARSSATQAISAGERTATPWLVLGGRMTLGAALAATGLVHAGEEMLQDAVRSAEAAGLFWFAGWSELALGKSLSHHVRSTADLQAVIGALRRAAAWFRHEDAAVQLLITVHAAVRVLVGAGRCDDAARLRSAVLHHAELLGVGVATVAQAGSGVLEIELPEARRVVADAEGLRLSWAEMVDLAGLDG